MDPKSFLSLDGRLSRRDFLMYYGAPLLLFGALPGVLLPHGPTQVTLESAVVLLSLPGITKRLHDAGYSLWPFVVVSLFYAGVLAVQTTGVFGDRRSLIILLAGIPFLGLILALYFIRGTRGPNRFGVDPLTENGD